MQMLDSYRAEIVTLRALKDAGLIKPHRHRDTAIREFATAIDAETSEIMVIGSSLEGVLQREEYREVAAKLRFKVERLCLAGPTACRAANPIFRTCTNLGVLA